MEIEVKLLKEYNSFIKANSAFGSILTVLPDTPQSFSSFPTIIFKESDNIDNANYMSMNRQEYGDLLTYQIDIYTKNVFLNNTEYNSRIVINELKELTAKFFRNCGFDRNSNVRGEYTDISVKRQTMLFSGTINNWNKKIS